MIKNSDRFEISKQVVARKISGKIHILNLKNEKIFELEGMGIDLWEKLNSKPTIDEMNVYLNSRYAGGPKKIEKHAVQTIKNLLKFQLILKSTQARGVK